MNKTFLWILIGVVVVLIGGFFVLHSGSSANVVSSGSNAPIKTITLDASRFQYSPGTITVNKGDHVHIVINNVDTTHGIAIPDFGVSGVDSVDFVADKTGTFTFKCPTMCGSGHRTMTGTLIVQ